MKGPSGWPVMVNQQSVKRSVYYAPTIYHTPMLKPVISRCFGIIVSLVATLRFRFLINGPPVVEHGRGLPSPHPTEVKTHSLVEEFGSGVWDFVMCFNRSEVK